MVLDTKPSEPKNLLELKVKKAAAAAAPGGAGPSGEEVPQTPAAAAVAGLISENFADEGTGDAALPDEFDYQTDTELGAEEE